MSKSTENSTHSSPSHCPLHGPSRVLPEAVFLFLRPPANQQQQHQHRYPGQIDLKEPKKRQTRKGRHDQNRHQAVLAGAAHQQRSRPGTSARAVVIGTGSAGRAATRVLVRRGRLAVGRQLRVVVVHLAVAAVLDAVRGRVGDVLEDVIRRRVMGREWVQGSWGRNENSKTLK